MIQLQPWAAETSWNLNYLFNKRPENLLGTEKSEELACLLSLSTHALYTHDALCYSISYFRTVHSKYVVRTEQNLQIL